MLGTLGAAIMRPQFSEARTRRHHEKHHEKTSLKPIEITMSDRDLDILTRTLWGEARGEREEGKIAVAHVIFNRVRSERFKPVTTVAKACMQRDQFSCWDDRREMWHISKANDEYRQLKETAIRALWMYREGHDYSGHATFYLKCSGRHRWWPDWTREMRLTKIIGHHAFLKPMVG